MEGPDQALRQGTADRKHISIPWALLSWALAYYEYYLLALPCSALFFLTALRQVHNGFHRSLGTGRRLTWFTLYSNSILMMASMHAVKFNHLRHHQYCLGEDDYEGKSARMRWWEAILYGPVHMYHIHRVALRKVPVRLGVVSRLPPFFRAKLSFAFFNPAAPGKPTTNNQQPATSNQLA